MTDDPKPVTVQKSNWTTIVTIASISSIFVIFIAALWGAGFFTFTGSDPSSKIVAAALALVGGLVAAIVSIVGILLKYSIDQRTEMRLQIESNRAAADRKTESDRANALQTQAEQRLNLEAAIRAVELLGGPEDSTTALQRAGALYALSTLNQDELTLDLTSYLLERGDLEPNVACTLINRGLKSKDELIQRRAVDILYGSAERMVTPSGTSVPDSIINWDDRFSAYVREWATGALTKILLGRPLSVWQTEFGEEANTIVATLALAWQSESDERLKRELGAMLEVVLKAFSPGDLYHWKGLIVMDQIAEKIAGSVADSVGVGQIVEELEAWRLAQPEPETNAATDEF